MPSQMSQAAHGLAPALIEGAGFPIIGCTAAPDNQHEVQLRADQEPEER